MKLIELNSIRHRLLTGFLFLTFIMVLMAGVSLHQINRIRRVLQIHNSIGELQAYNLSLTKTHNNFLQIDKINDEYFIGNSYFLPTRDSLLQQLKSKIANLLAKSAEYNYPINKPVRKIDSLMTLRNETFSELEKYYFQKGFRDHGIEGEMRQHAHRLESPSYNIDLASVLSLRRREKDFLLREDTAYVNLFNQEWNALNQKLRDDPHKNPKAVNDLTQYHRLFNELVNVRKLIGLKGEGRLARLSALTDQLNSEYLSLELYSRQRSNVVYNNAVVFFIIVFVVVFTFSIISAFWISKRLSSPIAKLSEVLRRESIKRKELLQVIKLKVAADEIKTLAASFERLLKERDDQMKEIKIKSKELKKSNKELKKTNIELDSFLYSTAHDLRSPLSSLLGLIRLIVMENKQKELENYFVLMKGSISRLEDFLQQIVDYSKNKKVDLHVEKINLKKMVNEALENHQFLEGAEHIEKIVSIKEEAAFHSDKNRLTIIFNNLISNATRYADHSKEHPFINIHIRTNTQEMILDFSDNGQGIEEDHIKKIFDMFYRGNTKSKGSGLGLFIFKETVNKLDGFASVESRVGEGTKFFIRIPNKVDHLQQHLSPLVSQN
jgi:signal transduction histidine kinase